MKLSVKEAQHEQLLKITARDSKNQLKFSSFFEQKKK
jgi:hypothetical protein